MDVVRRRYEFFNGIDVSAKGSRGGLNLGWNGNSLVNFQSFLKNHIDAEIQEDGNSRWHFTRFYGAPEVRNKSETWELLRRLRRNNSLPWLRMQGWAEDPIDFISKPGGFWRSQQRGREVKRLTRRLEELNYEEKSEENLGEIVEVKLHLNMEMDKEEKY
ncbi:hypothetical protein CXB51_015847 [Gossypium anomalum]|uniref:Uncharacterized protein n=1 Tax=Gossypium anomalum TaxID=47600 RepID=A0A8J5Z276_9ROSI|nr:hypothetical protein CXB51_015847 [Gossypium anomalum]